MMGFPVLLTEQENSSYIKTIMLIHFYQRISIQCVLYSFPVNLFLLSTKRH